MHESADRNLTSTQATDHYFSEGGLSSGLVSYLGTRIMFAGYLILRFKDGREIRQINTSQTLMNLQ